ncbi:Uncharacterised protein [Legionella moravica]|uniref:Uncharacterized protein n=1 Tax=Legionella moravica TaxID=39962 RepID=A0A378JX48_9GAMM|nr:Uncharacterised protein [Legionella moravica]
MLTSQPNSRGYDRGISEFSMHSYPNRIPAAMTAGSNVSAQLFWIL